MFYREVGQYRTTYRADTAIFPIRQDRIGILVILAVAFVAVPLLGNSFLLDVVATPFLIYALASIGLNLLTGYTGLLSLGTGGLDGDRRLHLLQAHHLVSRRRYRRLDFDLGSDRGRHRRALRRAELAHQGVLSAGRDLGGAVLPAMGVRARAVALQQQYLRRHRGADADAFRPADHRAERDAGDTL